MTRCDWSYLQEKVGISGAIEWEKVEMVVLLPAANMLTDIHPINIDRHELIMLVTWEYGDGLYSVDSSVCAWISIRILSDSYWRAWAMEWSRSNQLVR